MSFFQEQWWSSSAPKRARIFEAQTFQWTAAGLLNNCALLFENKNYKIEVFNLLQFLFCVTTFCAPVRFDVFVLNIIADSAARCYAAAKVSFQIIKK